MTTENWVGIIGIPGGGRGQRQENKRTPTRTGFGQGRPRLLFSASPEHVCPLIDRSVHSAGPNRQKRQPPQSVQSQIEQKCVAVVNDWPGTTAHATLWQEYFGPRIVPVEGEKGR